MNEISKLPKWIIASLAKHFKDACVSNILPMYLEGTGRKANTSPNYFEFRLNGPYVNQTLLNEYKIWVTINILLVNTIDEQNHYVLNANEGVILGAFVPSIGIFRFGTDINDDESLVECVVLDPDPGEKIKVTNFGQLSDHVRVMESTVEATYQMYYHPTPPYV